MRVIFGALLVFCCVRPAVAQVTPQQRGAVSGAGEIHGRLIDSVSGKAVTSGSVAVRRAGDSAFVSGALPKDDGSFRVDGLRPGTYSIRVRAIGFAPLVRNNITITSDHPTVDLGVVALNIVATKLEAEQTTAEREDVVLAPDRTSYNVKNMPVASGGTAIDVLRNIPLVEVDGSNNVSLRGNANVVIQINGRNTPLKGDQLAAFLAQLPAGTVKNIEVATNPSAKDDPEGTAGIINIVLNTEAQLGLSGGVNAGTASTGMVNGGGNIGQQRGKLIVFGSANVYQDRRETSGTISRTNLLATTPAFTETELSGRQSPLSGGGNIRSEYRFTDRTSLSFDSYLFAGHFGGTNSSDYTDLDQQRAVVDSFSQYTSQISRSGTVDLDMTFRHTADKSQPLFSTELEYANSRSTMDQDLLGSSIPTEHDHTLASYPYLNWKTDYTLQLGANTKLETGAKVTSRTTSSDFDAAYLTNGEFVPDTSRRSGYDYHEDIGAGYLLVSNRLDKLQTQAGLRLEDAATYFDLTTVDEQHDRRYASAYPSAIVSYNFTPLRSVRLSYSRRVSRPNPFQLSPIEQRLDTRNVFVGNPDLRAEYTDAIEAGYQETRSWGTIQLNPYIRSTAHAVRNIQYVDSTGVSVSTFDNVASTLQLGTDLNLNAHHGPLMLGGGASVYHYSSDASNLAGNLSTHAVSWSARANATWTFDKKTDAQFFTFYRAPYKTEGGSQIAMVSMNLAARYKVWGDKGNISLRVSDPFKLQKFGYRTANGTVIETSERFFGSRAVYLTITRNFGQALKLQPKVQDPDATPATPGGPPGA